MCWEPGRRRAIKSEDGKAESAAESESEEILPSPGTKGKEKASEGEHDGTDPLKRLQGEEINMVSIRTRPTVPRTQGAVTRNALVSLAPGRWLDDDALNALIEVDAPDDLPILVLGSHSWEELEVAARTGGSVASWLDVRLYNSVRRIILPLNQNNCHWLGLAIWLPDTLEDLVHAGLYDPSGCRSELSEHVRGVLHHWLVERLQLASGVSVCAICTPQQRDSCSCGVFVARWTFGCSFTARPV